MTKKYIIIGLSLCIFWQKSFADTLSLATILTQFENQYQVFVSCDYEEIKSIQIDFEFLPEESKENAIKRLLKQCQWEYESFDNKYFVLFKKREKQNKNFNANVKIRKPTNDHNQLFNRQLQAMLIDEATQVPIYLSLIHI